MWRLRVESAVYNKGLTAAFTSKESPTSVAPSAFETLQKQVSGIIFEALGYSAFHVVRTLQGRPVEMLEKLDGRYDSRTTASKISKMIELVSLRFTNPRSDIKNQTDRMAAVLQQVAAMKDSMDEGIQVGMLFASIDVVEMRPVIAALKKLADADVKWDSVANSLIEEWRAIKKSAQAGESSVNFKIVCDICNRPGNRMDKCWINPANPHNRLQALKKTEAMAVQKKTFPTMSLP